MTKHSARNQISATVDMSSNLNESVSIPDNHSNHRLQLIVGAVNNIRVHTKDVRLRNQLTAILRAAKVITNDD